MLPRLRPGAWKREDFWFLESVETPCIQEGASPEYIHRIILLSDGQANHRIGDPKTMVKRVAEMTEW